MDIFGKIKLKLVLDELIIYDGVSEPAVIALLGLGGLTLLRCKK